MNTIFYDSALNDETRRKLLYNGQLFVFSPRPSSLAFCQFAQELIQDAFGTLDPREAQHHMSVEQYAPLLAELKPMFIHHPKSKQYIQELLEELGCELKETYFDVPRMRTATSGGYLTTGIAYAWHPHRDTWYSAPACQLNWWIPIYDIESENAMAFHTRYWNRSVKNNSSVYNYYQWNKMHLSSAEQHLKKDPRPLPRPTEPVELDPQIRVICPAGGIIIFSAAQMHSTVPNTSGRTRFSIDFRTVNLNDVASKRGAMNIDSACTGISLRDFLCGEDLSALPEDVVLLYNDGTEQDGQLVYKPPVTAGAGH